MNVNWTGIAVKETACFMVDELRSIRSQVKGSSREGLKQKIALLYRALVKTKQKSSNEIITY